jgi:hypothetical protein
MFFLKPMVLDFIYISNVVVPSSEGFFLDAKTCENYYYYFAQIRWLLRTWFLIF